MAGFSNAFGRLGGLALVAALVGAGPAAAQEGTGSTPEAAGSDAPQVKPEAGRQNLEKAYKREFAFLEAQKKSLEKRLRSTRARTEEDRAELEQQVQALKDRAVRLKTRIETAKANLDQAEERLEANQSSQQVLSATFTQAGATLEEFGFNMGKGSQFQALEPMAKIERLFAMGNQALARAGSVRRTSGEFYRRNGTQVSGTIIKVGQVAAYGISDAASGVLVPAGGGALKLWQQPAPEAAEQLARGNPPEMLPIFLYDNINQEVAAQTEDTLVGTIQKGGMVGWIIVAMGALAGLLALVRAGFLQWASASTRRIIDQVGDLVSKGQVDDAQDLCERRSGAAWKVVGAAVRNLDRDREHLEDIISESILRESTRLDRFGPLIIVIAAVSPLLGLLGTVTGMISTFEVITEHGTGDPKLLSGGISVALVTTQLGLVVAVPTLLVGNLLSGWAERIKNDMEKAALRITNLYSAAR
jgi:biopolymer transport protein ExbB